MEYRIYGNTGKRVSVLGFGGMRFENPMDIDKSVKTVMHAFNRGINYFDTAPGYYHDKSEIILGHAVLEMKRTGRPFFISTKSMKSNGSQLRRDLEKSLSRLKVDAIDFYNCWCILTLKDWEERKRGGAVREILKAKEEGLIRHAVFSTHLSGPEIRKVVEEDLFEGVTLGYSAINFPYRDEGITAAAENNMGVVVMNPLGGGIIVRNPDIFSFIKVFPGQSIVEAALHFLMSNNNITVSIVGFKNEREVDEAVDAVESYKPYTLEQVNTIRAHVENDFNNLCTTCMYCNVCPEGIPVWKFVESCNQLILKSDEPVWMRLKYHWGVGIDELDKCTECRKCEEACTQSLPILERFEMLKQALQADNGKNL